MTDSEVKKASESHEDEISRTPKNIGNHFALQLNQAFGSKTASDDGSKRIASAIAMRRSLRRIQSDLDRSHFFFALGAKPSRNEKNFYSNSFPLQKMTDSEVKKASESHEDEISRTPKNIASHFALQLNQVSA
ncbi:hypothetical protein CEXT_775151 [Caerostris extrusa]|uniref:Uncharacterized protein n=1 Tax=Caerostris extrusa TaxID=172846 RepID=A0AAV4N8J6_CAEEX|nr:hypothetical protein CEXT_775151 [Caerostris extrusa]